MPAQEPLEGQHGSITSDDVLVEGDRFVASLPVEEGVVVLLSSHHIYVNYYVVSVRK